MSQRTTVKLRFTHNRDLFTFQQSDLVNSRRSNQHSNHLDNDIYIIASFQLHLYHTISINAVIFIVLTNNLRTWLSAFIALDGNQFPTRSPHRLPNAVSTPVCRPVAASQATCPYKYIIYAWKRSEKSPWSSQRRILASNDLVHHFAVLAAQRLVIVVQYSSIDQKSEQQQPWLSSLIEIINLCARLSSLAGWSSLPHCLVYVPRSIAVVRFCCYCHYCYSCACAYPSQVNSSHFNIDSSQLADRAFNFATAVLQLVAHSFIACNIAHLKQHLRRSIAADIRRGLYCVVLWCGFDA